MIPTYISAIILKPGAKWSFGHDPSIFSLDSPLGAFYYSVTRDQIIADGDELTGPDGEAAETLFFITDIREVSPMSDDQYPWMVDYLANAGYEDLEAGNMKAMYEIAKSLVVKDKDDPIQLVSFLGGWEVHSHYDDYEGYNEIDGLEFVGQCEIKLCDKP